VVLDAHVEHGGCPGPVEPTAFSSLFRNILDGFAHHLRAATGRLPVSPERRAASEGWIPVFARGLPETLGFLDGWVVQLGRTLE
jgi:hypothetical protein